MTLHRRQCYVFYGYLPTGLVCGHWNYYRGDVFFFFVCFFFSLFFILCVCVCFVFFIRFQKFHVLPVANMKL